jgi:hypothetical protein
LEAVDARLVFVIEDLDRTNDRRFDRQEVLALLQRLRESSPRFSFVLTAAQTLARDIDFAKLCDHIEILKTFDVRRISPLIDALRDHCLNDFADVPTTDDENPWHQNTSSLLFRFDVTDLVNNAARLLGTPRALKHALRRAYRVWQLLHGEVNLDDLLAMSILRHGAPEAFDFLLRYWNQLRDDPTTWKVGSDRLDDIRKRLTDEWRQATKGVEWDERAGLAMLIHLLPSAKTYLSEQSGMDRFRAQGIGYERYWLRIVNEEIDPDQARAGSPQGITPWGSH